MTRRIKRLEKDSKQIQKGGCRENNTGRESGRPMVFSENP
jgi:hypothetical protein